MQAFQAYTRSPEGHSHAHCRCSRWMTCPLGTTWGAAALSACCSAVHTTGSSQTPLMSGECRASGLPECTWHGCAPAQGQSCDNGHAVALLRWGLLRACAACRIEARHFGDLGQQVVNYHKRDLPRLKKDPKAYKVMLHGSKNWHNLCTVMKLAHSKLPASLVQQGRSS